MSVIEVHPDELTRAGAAIAGISEDLAAVATALRTALSAVTGHPDVTSAARDMSDRWSGHVTGLATAVGAVGGQVVVAAAAWTETDAAGAAEILGGA